MSNAIQNRSLPLTDWGVIDAQGDDAASFLHGQLTQDVLLLRDGQAHLAGFCSAKGRLLATVLVLKISAQHVLLLIPKANLPATLKRLSMFVLRAKVKLTDASALWQIWGQLGLFEPDVPGSVPAVWQVKPFLQGYNIALYPAPEASRRLLLLPAEEALPSDEPTLDKSAWDLAEVQAGVAFLHGELLDTFVPQMLNYESIGGVNFKKGCYPGQEVVARSQFRGTLKRRLYTAQSLQNGWAPGAAVFVGTDASDQPSGVVVQSAPDDQGGSLLMLVLQTDAATHHADDLHGHSPQGPLLHLRPLPYELLNDI